MLKATPQIEHKTSPKPAGNSNSAPKATGGTTKRTTANNSKSNKSVFPSSDSKKDGKSNLVFDSSRYKDNYDDRNNAMSALSAMQLIQNGDVFNIYGNTVMNKYDYREESVRGIQNVADGGRYNIKVDTDGDGEYEEMSAAEAMANSFDSELDLWIENKIIETINSVQHNTRLGIDINKNGLFSNTVINKLAEEGIVVEKLNDHTFVFSLVDENGNVLEDDNHKKGSIIFGDWAIPDGNFSASEQNMSSLLDVMGYDCISRADFMGNEQEYLQLLSQVQANIDDGLYQSSGRKTKDMYNGISISNVRTPHIKELMGANSIAGGFMEGNELISSQYSQLLLTYENELKASEGKTEEGVSQEKIRTAYENIKKEDSTISDNDAIFKVATQLNTTVNEVRQALA